MKQTLHPSGSFLSSFRRFWLIAALSVLGGAAAAAAVASLAPGAPAHDGARDFDFESGEWRVRHRVKRAG